MSYAAERWARSQKVGNASAKFVLIELANALNKDDVECYPGIDTLEEATELNRKTVIASTKLLEEKGFIKKRRTLENGKQRIYYSFPAFNHADWELKNESPKNGTFKNPKNGTLPPKSTKNGTSESTKNGTAESTKNGTVTGNKNREIEQVIDSSALAPASGDLFTNAGQKLEAPKKPSKGSRLTITDLPDDWKTFAEEAEPDLDPHALWLDFRDYWISVPGQKGVKLNWLATWRNFVRGVPDWKRKNVMKPEAKERHEFKSKFTQREKLQKDREYGL